MLHCASFHFERNWKPCVLLAGYLQSNSERQQMTGSYTRWTGWYLFFWMPVVRCIDLRFPCPAQIFIFSIRRVNRTRVKPTCYYLHIRLHGNQNWSHMEWARNRRNRYACQVSWTLHRKATFLTSILLLNSYYTLPNVLFCSHWHLLAVIDANKCQCQ